MSKRGKTPSLIGGCAGRPKFEVAIRKRTCKRCDSKIIKGENCVKVSIPSGFGEKIYCLDCFADVIKQTQIDLTKISCEFEEISGVQLKIG